MIHTIYNILFSIELGHDYYNNSVIPFNDIEVSPDEETTRILNGHRILYRKLKNRLVALVEIRAGKPFIQIAPDTRFRFYLTLKKPDFFNISSLPFFNTQGKIYYFTNKVNNEKGDRLYLNKPIPPYDSTIEYEMCLMVKQGTKIFEAIKKVQVNTPPANPSFWRELINARFLNYVPGDHVEIQQGAIVSSGGKIYTALRTVLQGQSIPVNNNSTWRELAELSYVTHEDLVPKTDDILDRKTENKIKEKVIGVTDLFFDAAVPANYAMIDGTGIATERNYFLRFKNRVTTWQYISDLNTVTSITDTDGVYSFNNQLTSEKPIPLLALPFQNFRLQKVSPNTTIDHIRCATSSIIPDSTTQSFLSQIHLNF